jgi:hypothetical protein
MNTKAEMSSQPVFAPPAFAVMSVLALQAQATLANLEERLHETHDALGAVVQELIDAGR